MEKLIIEIRQVSNHHIILLTIYSRKDSCLNFVRDAKENGESPYQLKEECEYEYKFDEGYDFEIESGIVFPSKLNKYSGVIKTGINVGELSLNIVGVEDSNRVGTVEFEVCSVKANYRTDYRKMLEDITAYYTELVMQQGAPITQKFEVNASSDPKTNYQRFAFIQSIIKSENFSDSIHKIQMAPAKKWTDTEFEHDVSNIKRIHGSSLRQIMQATNRYPLPINHPLYNRLRTVPHLITVHDKKDTIDIPENRFIKYVLRSFLSFCTTISQSKQASERLKKEDKIIIEKLNQFLSASFFHQISDLNMIPYNSPILQKKEGYREVLQVWLMFDMAAKLTWTGGDIVYAAGKRNVAALYEYWLFFKLLEIVGELFHIDTVSKQNLIEVQEDRLNLSLKQGRMQVIKGQYKTRSRLLNVQFCYNRTFCANSDINMSGSWTENMRPDYTLSIWPGDITIEQAEMEELITHIHFDAKYKIDNSIFQEKFQREVDENTIEELDEEKKEQEKGTYKRADLLKMHAYKDAIRRTSGAYILYPGMDNKCFKGFHEIIPGLGAFALSPTNFETNVIAFRDFLHQIVNNFIDRTSDREKLAYYKYEVLNTKNKISTIEYLPENAGINRSYIPDQIYVLVGYFVNKDHLKWIFQSHLYNTRTGSGNGSLHLDVQCIQAKYILLHGPKNEQYLKKLDSRGPRLFSRNDLVNKKYPLILKSEFYYVFNLAEDDIEPELKNIQWDFSRVTRYAGHLSAVPTTISLSELMKCKINVQ